METGRYGKSLAALAAAASIGALAHTPMLGQALAAARSHADSQPYGHRRARAASSSEARVRYHAKKKEKARRLRKQR